MHKLETNQPDQCMFKDTQLEEPTHSNLLRRCLGLMNCYDPAERDIEDQLLVAATPLTTDVLMHTIRKHMDSMDYLGHQNGNRWFPLNQLEELLRLS